MINIILFYMIVVIFYQIYPDIWNTDTTDTTLILSGRWWPRHWPVT